MYGAWAFVYCIVLLDDSLQIHERFGRLLIANFDLPIIFNLREQDTGEIITWTGLALPILISFYYGLSRSTQSHRSVGKLFAILFSTLLFFAIGADMIHSAFKQEFFYIEPGSVSVLYRAISFMLGVLEDGGGMLVLSFTLAFAVTVHRYTMVGPSVLFAKLDT